MGQVQLDELRGILRGFETQLGPVTDGPWVLAGGITNRNFRVRFGELDCVVRLPGKDTRLLGIDREAERLANEAAAKLALAPAVLAASDRALVTEYVTGRPLEADEIRSRPEALGAALRSFHSAGVGLPERFWVPDLLDAYARSLRERGARVPGEYAVAQRIAGRIARALPLHEPVACHNDLLPANVLRVQGGEAVVLVDWEYAGMGHRFFDLGNLAVNAELDEAAEERLLRAYLDGPPSAGQRAALRLMRIMSDAREAAWGVIQGVISELAFDFAGYAARHFERLAAAAADPRLEEWLDGAAA